MASASDMAAARSRLAELFRKLPGAYRPEEDWSAELHFEVEGAGDYRLSVDGQVCTTGPGAPASPTCTVRVEAQTLEEILQGDLRIQLALMTGRLEANNVSELMKLAGRFDLDALQGTVSIPALPPAEAEPEPPDPAELDERAETVRLPDLSTPGGRIDYLFERIPDAFVTDAAGSWKAGLHFAIGGAGDYQIVVQEGSCTSGAGKPDTPTCVIRIDEAETLLGMVDGTVQPQQAFLTGKIKASNMAELMRFGQVFKLRNLRDEIKARPAPEPAEPVEEAVASRGPDLSTPGGRIDYLFERIPDAFVTDAAGSWKAGLHFAIGGAGDYQIVVQEGSCTSGAGKPDTPTCVIRIDEAETLLGMVDGTVQPQQAFLTGKIKASNMGELMKFGQVFKLKSLRDKIRAPATKAAKEKVAAPKAPATPMGLLMGRLPEQYRPDPDFQATILLTGDDFEAHTLTVQGPSCTVEAGETGDPTCIIRADAATMTGLLTGTLDRVGAMRDGLLWTDHVSTFVRLARSFDFEPPAGDLNKEIVGKFYRGKAVFARAEEMIAFAEATNDPNPRYVNQERHGGIVAHPIFVMRLAGGVMLPIFTDPELNLDLTMMVHSEQDMLFVRPLGPWALVSPRAKITAIEDRSTGQVFRVNQRYYSAGDLMVEVTSSFFVRSRYPRKKAKKPAPAPPERKLLFTDSMQVAEDQSIRYGHASGDINPILMDDEAARAARLPGKILQGLCTMAFCSRAIVQSFLGGNPAGLRRLKVRFSHYVLPGDTLITSVWRVGEEGEVTTLGFETVNQEGRRVITDGLAEVVRGQRYLDGV